MKLFVVLIPIWLFANLFPPTLDWEYKTLLQFAAFVWLPIIACFVAHGQFLVGPLFRIRPSMFAWTTTSVFAITLSALLCVDPLRSMGYVATAAVGLITCAGLWQLIGRKLPQALSIYTVAGTLFNIYLYFEGPRVQERLTITDQTPANYLGLLSFGFLMCSFAIGRWWLSTALIVANFVIIIATQSRSGLIASIVGAVIYLILRQIQIHKARTVFVVGGILLLSLGLLLMFQDLVENSVSSLLFLDNKYRGLGTGFTGRLGAWHEAADLFLSNPWFGVGFRMHESYMTTLSSAHNGYLSLFAEVGIVGALPLLTLVFLACWNLLRQSMAGDSMAALSLSFVLGYLFVAAFERYFLNMGNPTSILAWLFLLYPGQRSLPLWREQPQNAFGYPSRLAQVG